MQDINTNIAKNVIIFVGDGMSLPTVTASRIYKAQYDGSGTKRKEVNGEESLLFFETFPHGGLSKVIQNKTGSKFV
jgi:alkaline phosphatase